MFLDLNGTGLIQRIINVVGAGFKLWLLFEMEEVIFQKYDWGFLVWYFS
jgi:hypothetical protein